MLRARTPAIIDTSLILRAETLRQRPEREPGAPEAQASLAAAERSEFGVPQGLAEIARLIGRGDTIVHVIEDCGRNRAIDLL